MPVDVKYLESLNQIQIDVKYLESLNQINECFDTIEIQDGLMTQYETITNSFIRHVRVSYA